MRKGRSRASRHMVKYHTALSEQSKFHRVEYRSNNLSLILQVSETLGQWSIISYPDVGSLGWSWWSGWAPVCEGCTAAIQGRPHPDYTCLQVITVILSLTHAGTIFYYYFCIRFGQQQITWHSHSAGSLQSILLSVFWQSWSLYCRWTTYVSMWKEVYYSTYSTNTADLFETMLSDSKLTAVQWKQEPNKANWQEKPQPRRA